MFFIRTWYECPGSSLERIDFYSTKDGMAKTWRLFYTTFCHCGGWGEGSLFQEEGVPTGWLSMAEETLGMAQVPSWKER